MSTRELFGAPDTTSAVMACASPIAYACARKQITGQHAEIAGSLTQRWTGFELLTPRLQKVDRRYAARIIFTT
jgi:hypothetical protein